MSDKKSTTTGKIGWIDLTVPDAEKIKEFYSAVADWQPTPVNMGSYDDYTMTTINGEAVAGICHNSGPNAVLPSQWLVYINVEDLDVSLKKCKEMGGEIIAGPFTMESYGRYCVFKDPAGAVAALFEPVSP